MCYHVNMTLSSPCWISLLQPYLVLWVHNKIYLSNKTIQSPIVINHLALLLRNNWVQSKAALFAGLQTAYSPQGHYPAQEMRKWAPDVTGKPLAQNVGLNWEGGGEGHARSEFRHVYITAQDISQSPAKLLKFPGSRVAECWKEAQAFTFSSLLSLPLLCSGV